jgi:hypothetical protein
VAVSTPIGQIRYNPNTNYQEVWNGNSWVDIDDSSAFVPLQTTLVPNGGITVANTSTITNVGKMTENAKEDLYLFLNNNIRVAEYLDENGKVDYVQLELREGEGCVWENIQRVRIK